MGVTISFRAGYEYAPSPVPNQPFYSNYLDTTHHIVSAGIGIKLKDPTKMISRPISLDIAVQDQILIRRSLATLSAYSPGFSSYTLGGHTQ